jgi:hypothetical protein
MSKIIKSVGPLIVAWDYEAHRRRLGQWLNYLDRNPRGTLGSRLSQRPFDDLGPGSLGAQILHQVSHCKITGVRGTAEHDARSSIGFDHGPTAFSLTVPGCSPRRIAKAIASSSRPGTSCPARSAMVQARRWMRNQQRLTTIK